MVIRGLQHLCTCWSTYLFMFIHVPWRYQLYCHSGHLHNYIDTVRHNLPNISSISTCRSMTRSMYTTIHERASGVCSLSDDFWTPTGKPRTKIIGLHPDMSLLGPMCRSYISLKHTVWHCHCLGN